MVSRNNEILYCTYLRFVTILHSHEGFKKVSTHSRRVRRLHIVCSGVWEGDEGEIVDESREVQEDMK